MLALSFDVVSIYLWMDPFG